MSDPITDNSRKTARHYLDVKENEFRNIIRQAEALAGPLNTKQLSWKPGAGDWSISQQLWHLIRTNGVYLKRLEKEKKHKLEKSIGDSDGVPIGFLARLSIRQMEPPLKKRYKAPRKMRPPKSPKDVIDLEAFVTQQNQIIERIQNYKLQGMPNVSIHSPVFWLMRFNFFEAVAFLAAHARRHLWHIEQIKKNPQFPAQ